MCNIRTKIPPPERVRDESDMTYKNERVACVSILCIYVLGGGTQQKAICEKRNSNFLFALQKGKSIYKFFVVVVFFAAKANGAALDILPHGEVQTKAVGSAIILTCKPDIQDTKLITDIQWLDPHDRVIESQK